MLFAVTEGHMDDVPIDDVRRFERELRENFRNRHSDVLTSIRETGKLPEGSELVEGIEAFQQTFEASEKVEA